MFTLFVRRPCALAATALFLTACGGGGGGGGSGTPDAPKPPVVEVVVTHEEPMPTGPVTINGTNGLNVTIDKSSLRMVGIKGAGMPEAGLNFTLASAPVSGVFYAMGTSDRPDSFTVAVGASGEKSMHARIIPGDIPVGVASGKFSFKLCSDVNCNTVVWSATVPYQTKMFSVTSTSLALTGFQGTTTVDKSLLIAPADTLNELELSPQTSAPGWLSAKFAGKTGVEVTALGAGLPVGQHRGEFELATRAAEPFAKRLKIAVSLTNGPGMVLPADKQADLNAASAVLVNDTIALAFNGGQTPAWKASSDRPWLILGAAQGSGPASIGYTIDHSKLASLENFSADSARVTIKPDLMDAAVMTVTINKKLPEISMISPNPLIGGAAAQVRVRGRGLQQIKTGTEFLLAGASGVTATVISDTEARLSLPALANGTRVLSVPAASGLQSASQVLSVVPFTTFDPALLSSPGKRNAMLYNAARNAIYTIDRSTSRLERYSITLHGLVKDRSVPIAFGAGIGMAINGETLYSTLDNTALEERNPDTLAVTATHAGYVPLYNYILQITDDNRIWFDNSTSYFDTVSKKFGRVTGFAFRGQTGRHYASADGSRMVNTNSSDASAKLFLRYEPNTGTFEERETALPLGYDISLSADGTRVVASNLNIYDSTTFAPPLPGATTEFIAFKFLSRDGRRLFIAYRSSGEQSRLGSINVIDTASRTIIGVITLPFGVAYCNYTYENSSQCDWLGALVLSPLENAFFWAGDKGIAVVPIPPGLMPAAAAPLRIRPAR